MEQLQLESIEEVLLQELEEVFLLEAELQVAVELPGQNLPLDTVGSGSFLTIATSMLLRGRKKHVEQASAHIAALARAHALETLTLPEEDSCLLARRRPVPTTPLRAPLHPPSNPRPSSALAAQARLCLERAMWWARWIFACSVKR